MHHHIPQLIGHDDLPLVGASSFADGIGAPLSFGHAYLTLLVCQTGVARFSLNFKECAIKPGDVLVLAEDTIALLRRRSRSFTMFFCLLPKNVAAEVAYPLPNALFMYLHAHPHCVPGKLDQPLVAAWLTQVRDIARNCQRYKHLMLRNQLQTLFLKIAGQIPTEQATGRVWNRKETISWRFWELVGKHCVRHRSVTFYATALSITPFYLSELTKLFFNDSPKGLIDRQVILEIKALLAYSDMPIGRIADRLCFDDASYLCRYFKRQTGISLSCYRKGATMGLHAADGKELGARN